jgi:hypothetical protein
MGSVGNDFERGEEGCLSQNVPPPGESQCLDEHPDRAGETQSVRTSSAFASEAGYRARPARRTAAAPRPPSRVADAAKRTATRVPDRAAVTALPEGAVFLAKPFSVTGLLDAVRSVLDAQVTA